MWLSPRTSPGRARRRGRRACAGLGSLRLLLALSITMPLLLLAGFAAYRHQQMDAEAELRLRRALSIAHEQALRILSINRTVLVHVRDIVPREPAMSESRLAELNAQLSQLAGGQPHVHAIHVRDAAGRVQASSEPRATRPADDLAAGQLEPSPELLRTGLHLTALSPPDARGERLFQMSLARFDDRAFAGTVSVSMRASYFTRLHETLAAEEPGVAITLFRQDGAVYSRWPPLPHAPERMSASGEVLSRVLAGATSGTVRNISSLDQQKRLILFQKLDDLPVYIGVGREFGALRSQLLRELGLLAAFGALPVLGLMFTAWLAMQRTRLALSAAAQLRQESDARRQAEEALFQSQKMEALGRLTGGVAHDFNNALMVISGNLHLLQRTVPDTARRHLEAIGRAVASSAQLTRQLLAFSRRQALAPETLSLQERLPAMEDLLAPTLGGQISLSIHVEPDTPPIHVDFAEVELALINLAVNARDAMPEGGTFTVRAGPAKPGDASWVVIEASDTGQGMDAAVAAKAFDPFFTTKPAGKGTGLGLSQVYALCHRAGGHASIRSAPGRGTTVAMYFPASSHALAEARVPQAEPVSIDRSVLLVEDNPEVAQVVRPVLETLGCSVVHVSSGEAALQVLQDDADRFDILLTDVVMPGGMDGASLAVAVRDSYPRVRILIMTGYAQQIEAIDALGFKVLAKPFTPEALAEAIGGLVPVHAGPRA